MAPSQVEPESSRTSDRPACQRRLELHTPVQSSIGTDTATARPRLCRRTSSRIRPAAPAPPPTGTARRRRLSIEHGSGSAKEREPIRGTVTASPYPGQGRTPATGGTACGPGVDFIAFTPQPFTFAAGSSGPFYFDVTICGDAQPEPTETFLITLGNVECMEKYPAVGIIRNDDGDPPPPPKECTFNGKPITCPPPELTPRCRMVNGKLVCP